MVHTRVLQVACAVCLVTAFAFASTACSAILGDFTVQDAAEDASAGDGGLANGTLPQDGGAHDAASDDASDGNAADDTGTHDGAVSDAQTGDGGGCAKTVCGAACADLQIDPKNCGACNHDCTALLHVASATGVTCVGGVCNVPNSACLQNYAHCSTRADDGCETDVSTTSNCHGCGRACAANEVCTATGCASSCPAGTQQCGSTCTDLTKDPAHCGDCNTACPQPPLGGNATCTNKVCGVTCVPNWHQCNTSAVCASDVDATQCGPTCKACSAPAGAIATCSAAAGCGFTCGQGLTNCNGACVACPAGGVCSGQTCGCPNGQSNCNGACTSCPQGGVCSGSQCICGNGTTNCSGTCVACPTNGVCSGTSCGCPSGTNLCGGTYCANFANDPGHCGSCTKACPSGSQCLNNNCTVCTAGQTMCSPCPGNTADDCIMVCNAARTGYDIQTDCGYAQPNDRCSDVGGAHCI